MSRAEHPFAELIDRYLAGESTPEEQARLCQLLAERSEEVNRLAMVSAKLKPLLEDVAASPTPYSRVHAGLQARVQHAARSGEGIASSGAAATPQRPRGQMVGERQWLEKWSRRGNITPYARMTALVAMIVMAMVGIARFAGMTTGHRTGSLFTSVLPTRIYTTIAGQHARIILADSSRVLLGPATTLAVTIDPSEARVDVRVLGQALFSVRQHAARIFRVHVGHAMAQVLGTTFMVRQYTADSVARIVVVDGRVGVSGTSRDAYTARRTRMNRVLTANMLGVVDDSGEVHVTPNIAVDDYLAWTTGELVFQRTPIQEAILELGHAYGVTLRVADSALAAQTLTWRVAPAQRSLTGVLESLADLLDAHPVREGRVITLVPGRSAQHRPVDPSSLQTSESAHGR